MRPFALILFSVLLAARPSPASQRQPAHGPFPIDRHDPLILDLAANGIDPSGAAWTQLLGEEEIAVRWTVPGTDDGFLIVDADGVRTSLGSDIQNLSGFQVHGWVLFRDGLRVHTIDDSMYVVTSGWNMLELFDDNSDGFIDENDAVWNHLALFVDDNANGSIDLNEDTSLAPLVDFLATVHGGTTLDEWGNAISSGLFARVGGGFGTLSDVDFASLRIFSDDFESGGTSEWSSSVP